jgi:hypothetical protein
MQQAKFQNSYEIDEHVSSIYPTDVSFDVGSVEYTNNEDRMLSSVASLKLEENSVQVKLLGKQEVLERAEVKSEEVLTGAANEVTNPVSLKDGIVSSSGVGAQEAVALVEPSKPVKKPIRRVTVDRENVQECNQQ